MNLRCSRFHGVFVVLLFALAAPSGSVCRASPGTLALTACELPGVAGGVRCGTFEVAENPQQPAGRHLRIAVAVLPATGGHALADPIVPMMGGPGESAIESAEDFAKLFATLRQDRDILLVDARGTGRSNALKCDPFSDSEIAASLRDLFPESAVGKCLHGLRQRADLTQYTYNTSANDLEQIRGALGTGQLNLYSASYGTRAAQVYARMYPQSVRTIYMGSAVPIDVRNPLHFAKTGQAALEKMLDACVADSGCHGAFPQIRAEFQQVAQRLASGPVSVSLPELQHGALLYRGRVAEWFRSRLYRPYSSTELPWLIHRAWLGDWNPIAAGIADGARHFNSELSFGLFLSITCSEDVPFITAADIAAQTSGTFLGDYRVRQQQAACKHWPRTVLPAGYRQPVRSTIPTLFASGDSDGGTPLWYAQAVAQGFANRREVLLQGQGHTEWSDCIARIYQEFVTSGSLGAERTTTCPPVPRPPFKTH